MRRFRDAQGLEGRVRDQPWPRIPDGLLERQGESGEVLDRLLSEGVQVKVPTTINPRPGRELNLTNRLLFSKQQSAEGVRRVLGDQR